MKKLIWQILAERFRVGGGGGGKVCFKNSNKSYHCEHGFFLCYHFILVREENNYGRMHIQMAIVYVW